MAALAMGAARAAPPAMAVSLPFDGAVRVGHPAELRVTLQAASGGVLELAVDAPGPGVRVRVQLQPGTPRTLAVPLAPAGDGPVTVRAFADGVEVARERAWPAPLPAAGELVAAAGVDPPPASVPGVSWRPVSAGSLPRTLHGYGPVSALVVGAGAVAGLDLDQARALEAYLAACGTAVLVALPAAAASELEAGAGCGGRRLATAAHGQAVAAALAALLGTDAGPPAPSPASLDALVAPRGDGATLRAVLLFLAGYALLAVLAALRAPRAAPLLPVGAALVAMLAWHGVAPTRTALLWSEQVSAHSARAVARLAAAGEGVGVAQFPLAAGLLPLALPPGAWRHVDASQGASAEAVLHLPARLLSATVVDLQGVIAMHPPLTLSLDAHGAQVRNSGPHAAPGAALVWHGRALAVPALAPGQSWRPAEGAAPAGGAAAALAVRRTPPGHAALLVPARLPLLPPGVESRGWLLVPPIAAARDA